MAGASTELGGPGSAQPLLPRVVPLAGGLNFRDLGGYPSADGRSVAWGRVYRSGTMAGLNADDHAAMQALGLRLVVDLRSTRERHRRPSQLPATPFFDVWFRDHAGSSADLAEAMRRHDATSHSTRDVMIALYRKLPYEQGPSYHEIFARLAANDTPMVFHCSAGKDRTGVAAALLLDVLGVPRDAIIDDFAMTDQFFDKACGIMRRDPLGDRLGHIDRAVWEPMLRAAPDYLHAMFAMLDERHGGAQHFVREELGISPAQITEIRENLLV